MHGLKSAGILMKKGFILLKQNIKSFSPYKKSLNSENYLYKSNRTYLRYLDVLCKNCTKCLVLYGMFGMRWFAWNSET